jgi:two-component system NtrC family response regulator
MKDERRRVLVVDEEQAIIDVFHEHLAVEYDVTSTLNGKRAVELFRVSRPHLMFLDVAMAGINGLDILKTVKEVDPTVPVIMITASRDHGLAAEALKHGAFSYLPKPFDAKYLEHLVAAALSGRTR